MKNYFAKRAYHKAIDDIFHPHFEEENGMLFRILDAVFHSFAYADKKKAMINTAKYTIIELKRMK